MDFAVLGGDARQVWLARGLREDGHRVRCAGLERGEADCVPLGEALAGARYVVLPLPAGGGETLNAPPAEEPIRAEELVDLLVPGQTVLAGKAEGRLLELLEARQIPWADYFVREELTVRNAAITTEGAIELLMRELPVTLLGSRILVVGFGRIGKLLALRLRDLGARVTTSARNPADLAWIDCLGFAPADTRRLSGNLTGYAAVVNTVPARVLDRDLLAQLDPGCLCLDLASKPGGVDFDAARELGVRAVWALALPGKTAPVSAAGAVREAVYNIIKELEN